MVKYQTSDLDRTFGALADPTRRALLARLSKQRSLSVTELARPFPMSLPAVVKHLDVLSDAGLITRTKTGRIVNCELEAWPMEDAMNWLTRYQRFWTERLDRLAAFLEEESCPPSQNSTRTSAGRIGRVLFFWSGLWRSTQGGGTGEAARVEASDRLLGHSTCPQAAQ
jgi:DNA-binding transcriptional ArsR family regulator